MAAPAPRSLPESRYAELEKELKRTLMHTLSDISSLPREKSYDRAHAVFLDVLYVTYAALASFGRAWNDIHRDPIAALPAELMSTCFSWLDLKSRISISHVSRTWRNAALSDRSLWTEYTVSRNSHVGADAGLRAMLSRSEPLRFRLTSEAAISDTLVEYIGLHMHRIQVLRLNAVQHDAVVRLMDHDAPLLEKFLYPHSKDPGPAVTLQWSASHAPRLRKITIGKFLIPTGSVFQAIRVFRGTLPAGGTFPGQLASIFPSLMHLVLEDINQIALGTLAALPCVLKTVVLNSSVNGLDYSGFLRACHALDMTYLYIHSTASVSDVVALAARDPDCPWNLCLTRDTYLGLGTAVCDYEIDSHRPISLVRDPVIMTHLRSVAGLTLSLLHYARLYISTSWTRALPALTRFTLITDHPDALRQTQHHFAGTPITAQALRLLSIEIAEHSAYKYCPPLADVAPVARSIAALCLEDLIICVHRPESVGPADLACLSRLAQRASVRGFRGSEAAIVLEASGPSS